MKNVNLEDLYKKYPFIYEVDGELYVIGHGVFRKNTSVIAERYFRSYRECVNKVGRENIIPYELSVQDADALTDLYKKVMDYASIAAMESDNEYKGKLFDFIYGLDKEKQDSLYEQLEDYIKVFWYYNRRFDKLKQ